MTRRLIQASISAKFLAASLVMLLGAHAQASMVTVTNGSFENPDTTTFDNNISNWFMKNQTADATIEVVQDNASNVNFPQTTHGTQWANIARTTTGTIYTGAIYQQIGTLTAGYTYEVSGLLIGQRGNQVFDGLRVALYAGNVTGANGTDLPALGATLLASYDINKADYFPTAALGTATVPDFTLTPGSYALAGEALWIHFSVLSQGTTSRPQSVFDNVNITTIPEPASLVLATLGGLMVFGRRRSR